MATAPGFSDRHPCSDCSPRLPRRALSVRGCFGSQVALDTGGGQINLTPLDAHPSQTVCDQAKLQAQRVARDAERKVGAPEPVFLCLPDTGGSARAEGEMNDIEARLREPTPWHATQRAAWEALTKAGADG